jgi:glycosyltransferase involved in cell wall biosynthesis
MSPLPLRILTLSTIYPNEVAPGEGRSVAALDKALGSCDISAMTLVLKPWAPHWLASRTERLRHLAVNRRRERRGPLDLVFDHYWHLPRRIRLDVSAREMARRAVQIVSRSRFRFDVVHGQSIFPAALAARLVAQRYRVPFVVTLRDDLSHHADMLRQGGTRLGGMYGEMFGAVRAVFAHGPGIERDVARYLPPDARCRLVLAPNGVDVAALEALVADAPLVPRPPAPLRHLVSVSHLYRLKGIHETLEALALLAARGLRNVHYTVVGDGPYRAELIELAARLGLADRVRFLGRLAHRDALAWIRSADVFCLASWAEAFGNVVAEAAVCGRPSIGCLGNGPEMLIRDGETGRLVPPRDVSALADALGELLSEPARAQAMGERAREHIRSFSWQRTGALYRQVLDEVVSHARLA